MEFQNENGTATLNGAATETNKNYAAQNGAAKTNGTAKATNGNGKGEAKDIKPAPAESKEPKGEANPQAAEPGAEAQPAKAELTLDAKLKAVADLHRRSLQRLALISRIKTLENFEVTLLEEGDELESNPYQACKLIIQDDKRREFVTMTPGLIRMVAQFIFNACAEKLEEIEATINFPTV